MASQTRHRIELLILSVVASGGMFVCQERHMWCGHLEHSSHDRLESWMFDSIWVFALAGVAVVGLRGRFRGARVLGMVCALMIGVMAATRVPAGSVGGAVLAVLAFLQLVGLAVHLSRRTRAEQAGAGQPGSRSGSEG